MKKLILSAILLTATIAVFSQARKVVVKSAEEKLNEQYCSGLFKTTDGTYFDMLDDKNSTSASAYLNILDWLQGRVAGLQIYRTRYNTLLPFIRNSRAGVYVDELYRDADYLNSLPVTDIAMIKIIKGPFAGGFNSPGGVIAIYTIGTEEEEEEE
jgi:hypothetical protein